MAQQTLTQYVGADRGIFSIFVRSEEYIDWPFMLVMFWGEDPTGEWTLTVRSVNINTTVNVSDVEFQFLKCQRQ